MRGHPVVWSLGGLLVGFLAFAALHRWTSGDGPSEYDAEGMTKEQRAADEAWGDAARRREMEEYRRNAPRPAVVKAPLLAFATSDLHDTVVVPVVAAPIPKGKNVLWCATWQLCWDALCDDVAKGPLVVGPPAPPEFSVAMNRRAFPHDALDPASCLAMAGIVKDGIVPRIRNQLKERFDAVMLDPGPLVPESAVAYGYLRKSLPFETLFEPRLGHLTFAGGKKRVAAFGVNHDTTYPDAAKALAQVTAWPVGQEGEFILEFAVKGGKDRLVLAMVEPRDTLASTWEAVRARTATFPGETLGAGNDLAVPKLNFEVSHRFGEIIGGTCSGNLSGQVISEARQTVRFSLDEGGADLESHAIIATAGMAPSVVVNRPFLISLVEKGKAAPYLLLWIANDELLAEVK
jgi:hypothetical protein